jgi:thiamine transport system ATP-binding protein
MLKLEGLELRQGDHQMRAHFQVARGQKIAVIGPSGAGKSTLLSAIAGFIDPVAGQVIWQDRDLTYARPAERPVAMLFQDGNLFPHLSVDRNVGMGLRPDLRLSADQKAQVATALSRVGLGGMGARLPGTLSGGQQSRAALARILVQNRPLLLLDEPFAALGPALRAEMLDLVAELCEETGATLLMVTHDPQDAARVADQVIVVAQGRADPPVETKALLADPPDHLRAYLGQPRVT